MDGLITEAAARAARALTERGGGREAGGNLTAD